MLNINNEPTISIFTTDNSLVVSSWDNWLTKATGLSEEVAKGSALAELIPCFTESGISGHFQRVLQHGIIETLPQKIYPYLFECSLTIPSRYFQKMQQRVTIAPLKEKNEIIGTIVTIEDITNELEIRLNIAEQLESPEENLRLVAVQTLAKAKISEPEQMLVKALGDRSWRVRRAAVDGLAAISGSTLATSLLRSLREEHRNPSVLNGVLQVLAHGKVDIVPALIDCLNSEDADLRVYAALALGEQKDIRAIPALQIALQDSDSNVQYHAIDALGHLQAIDAVEDLVAIACGGDFFLAFPALDALKSISLKEVNLPKLAFVANQLLPLLGDELLVTAVVDTLAFLGDSSVVSAIASLLNQPNPPVPNIVSAIGVLHDRYENAYHEGDYIADLAFTAIDQRGIDNLLANLHDNKPDELRAIALLLGRCDGNPKTARALTRLLGEEIVRGTVIEALVRYGKKVTNLLIEQLSAEDLEIRRAAVIALGRIGDSKAVPALTQLLTETGASSETNQEQFSSNPPLPELMVVTANSLAQIGDRRSFDTLLSLIGHPDSTVRLAVVAALNSLGHPDMLNRMITLLQDTDAYVRESAVKIAGYFAFNECVNLLLERCQDQAEDVRKAAIELIPYLENAPVLPTLIHALERETPKVRAAAARALGQMDCTLVYPHLLKALQDKEPWVRYYAAKAIGWNGYTEAIDTLANLAHRDPSTIVRIAAVEALGQIGGARVVSFLAPIAEDTKLPNDLVRAALSALGQVGHPNSLPPLLSALRSEDLFLRVCAVKALGKRGGQDIESILQDLAATDSDVTVVFAAIEALAQLATKEAIAALLELTANLKHNEACIIALANLGEKQVEAIGKGLTHFNLEVRCATVEVLTRLRCPRASELLIVALDDPEQIVRLAAVNGLEHLGNRYAERKIAVMAHTDPDPIVRQAAQKALG
ncbi:HEAT repeat domain-containing protein [Aerosakkonemataceae cyanobacterium BLCC-F154]|uniref:HEAT repeat domain-containing protein n=1 Tax=Floridaenema fluviatile BLCC-F154 TaxID=3153640 RepID=A0ABV4YDX0_9CYAN